MLVTRLNTGEPLWKIMFEAKWNTGSNCGKFCFWPSEIQGRCHKNYVCGQV